MAFGRAAAAAAPVATLAVAAELASAAANFEESAKQAWLAKLDAPTWGKAAATVAVAAVDAVTTQDLTEMCQGGVVSACGALSKEDEAKKAWLARLDAPTWGAVAAAVTTVAAEVAAQPTSTATSTEEAAKQAWLAKLDAPTWGKAASSLTEIAGASAVTQELTEKCDGGIVSACDALSNEEEAKKAWLAKLDAPTWGAVTAAVSTVAQEVSSSPAMSAEAIAKRAWLESIDSTPSWLSGAPAPVVAPTAAPVVAPTAAPVAPSAVAAVAPTSATSAEEAAKQAWLAKLDAPTWGATAPSPMAPPQVEEALAVPSADDVAKEAWLARLAVERAIYQPSAGAVVSEEAVEAAPAPSAAAAPSTPATADLEKDAWLARLALKRALYEQEQKEWLAKLNGGN